VALATTSEPGSKLQLFALFAAAAVARADALDDPVLDQQLGRRGLGEDVDAGLFGFLGEKAAELGDRHRVGPLFAEVRRRRLQRKGFALGEEVRRVLRHLLVDRRPLRRRQVGEEPFQRRGVDVGTGEQVGAGDFALLDHRDRDFAQLLGQLGLVLQQLHEFVGAGEPGGAAADDRDANLDALVHRIRRRRDDAVGIEGRRKLTRCNCHFRTPCVSWVGRDPGAPRGPRRDVNPSWL